MKNGTKGVLGALVDRIRIPSKYVNPVEALLGTRLQLVLAEKPDAARSILDQLKSSKKGMASIAPLDWEGIAEDDNDKQPTWTEESDPAPVRVLDIVQAEESILSLLRRLIGRAWIVPDLSAATRLWKQVPGQGEFVTNGCEILTRDGIFVGGSRKEVPVSSSILGRKNEIADLKTNIQKVEAEIEEIRRQRERSPPDKRNPRKTCSGSSRRSVVMK